MRDPNNHKTARARTGCVIPCNNGNELTMGVISQALIHADIVVLVDDGCPGGTGKIIESKFRDEDRVIVLFNAWNMGVGYSTKRGISRLISMNCEIIIKIDTDGQMDPNLMPKFCRLIKSGEAEAVKGNRFSYISDTNSMPAARLAGNIALSFITKISTGYWELFDPTNGYIALSSDTIRKIRLDKTDDRYFSNQTCSSDAPWPIYTSGKSERSVNTA